MFKKNQTTIDLFRNEITQVLNCIRNAYNIFYIGTIYSILYLYRISKSEIFNKFINFKF